MLDAYVRKGARLPTEPGEGRRVIEDAITSTLFGPLKFMTPYHAGQILSWFIGPQHRKDAEVMTVQLWPRFPADKHSSNEFTIEPDLVIDGCFGEDPFRCIIEAKWDAVLLRQQVEDQVRLCTGDRATWIHISLVKSAELAAFEFPGTTIIQWNQLLRLLRDVLRTSATEGASKIWCEDAIAFLEKLGVGTFEGFGHSALVPVMIESINLSLTREFSFDGLVEVEPVSFRFDAMGADDV